MHRLRRPSLVALSAALTSTGVAFLEARPPAYNPEWAGAPSAPPVPQDDGIDKVREEMRARTQSLHRRIDDLQKEWAGSARALLSEELQNPVFRRQLAEAGEKEAGRAVETVALNAVPKLVEAALRGPQFSAAAMGLLGSLAPDIVRQHVPDAVNAHLDKHLPRRVDGLIATSTQRHEQRVGALVDSLAREMHAKTLDAFGRIDPLARERLVAVLAEVINDPSHTAVLHAIEERAARNAIAKSQERIDDQQRQINALRAQVAMQFWMGALVAAAGAAGAVKVFTSK